MFERGRKDPERTNEPVSGDASARLGKPLSPGKPPAGETAVIGRSIQINGDLRGDEDLRIEGDVAGTVELRSSSLTIGKEGRVRADVYAKEIVVDGQVEGDLYASERISVRSGARVVGNVTAPRVGLEDGAKFKGSVEMDKAAVDRAFGEAKKPPSSVAAGHKPSETAPATPVKEISAS